MEIEKEIAIIIILIHFILNMKQALLNITVMREMYLPVWKRCTDSMTATLICH